MNKEQQIKEMANITYDKIKKTCGAKLKDISEALYNAGYRKIDENCAVITKDELKLYQRQAVKAFAEKLKMAFFYEFDEIIPSIMSDRIDELLKDYEK